MALNLNSKRGLSQAVLDVLSLGPATHEEVVARLKETYKRDFRHARVSAVLASLYVRAKLETRFAMRSVGSTDGGTDLRRAVLEALSRLGGWQPVSAVEDNVAERYRPGVANALFLMAQGREIQGPRPGPGGNATYCAVGC